MRKLLIAVASGPLLAGVASAQGARLDTIVVTAPGPDREADELIGAASVLDRETLVETLGGSLGETLDREPGVASTFFGVGASRPILRGLGAERVLVLTNGVGVIDASAASPDHQVTADAIDAQKIEILRGPAALAYGGQAIGGVVNVIDGLIAERAPERALSGEVFAAYNDVNEGVELGGLSSVSAGPLVIGLSASSRDFEDYEIPGFAESSRLRAAEGETGGVGGIARNTFVETESVGLGVSVVGDRGFFGVAVRNQASEYGLPGEEDEAPFIDLDQTRYEARGGLTVDRYGVSSVTASFASADYEHVEFEAPGEPGTFYATEGEEGRIEINHAIGGFEGAFGVQALSKTLRTDGEEAFVPTTETDGFGVFLFETREWESGFGVEGGLRFEAVESATADLSRDFDLVSGAFGVHRHLKSGWFFGAQLAYTERAPIETELFSDGPHLATGQYEIGNPDLDKETGVNLELVARWTGDSLRLSANAFATRFEDFIYLTPGQVEDGGVLVDELDGLPVFLAAQRDAEFYGGEIAAAYEIDGPLGANWELNAAVDYVSAELDGGGQPPFIPPLTFTGGANAEWGAWETGFVVTAAAEQDDPGAGQLPTDGYVTLDLRGEVDLSDFGLGRDGTEAFVEARNVTDEEVRFATSVLKDLVPAPGRNLRVGLRVAF